MTGSSQISCIHVSFSGTYDQLHPVVNVPGFKALEHLLVGRIASEIAGASTENARRLGEAFGEDDYFYRNRGLSSYRATLADAGLLGEFQAWTKACMLSGAMENSGVSSRSRARP